MCIRIWDNILVYGPRYLFKVTIAILKLVQDHLFSEDISGVNEFFKTFKDEEGSGGSSKNLPEFEKIIKESLKVKISEEWLDEMKIKYKNLHSPKKS